MPGVDIIYRSGHRVQPRVKQGDEGVGGVQVRGDGLACGGEGTVQVLPAPGGAHHGADCCRDECGAHALTHGVRKG
jgi:hypothetical protein